VRLPAARVLGWAAAAVVLVSDFPPAAARAQTTASVIHVTETSSWPRPSPDPMGLAYLPSRHRLIVADSEVDEVALFDGANVFMLTAGGSPKRGLDVTSYTREPADVAVGPGGRSLLFADDLIDRIFRVRPGRDGRWGTDDDRVAWFPTKPFGSSDPEGLGYGAGSLFITDGIDKEVYRLDAGANHRFDGVAPSGDDVVTSFDTSSLGLRDPEDVAFDRESGHLFLISRTDLMIVEVTTEGELVDSVDISSSGIDSPAGVVLAPGSDDPGVTHVYVADRGVDNNDAPAENDGRIFEFELIAGSPA